MIIIPFICNYLYIKYIKSFVPQRIQSTISEVDKGTLDFLNREPSDRVLDLEEKFMKELPADSSFIDSVHIIFPGKF